MREGAYKTLLKVKSLRDLVVLRIFSWSSEEALPYLYILPVLEGNDDSSCIFFFDSYNFPERPVLLYSSFFTKDAPKQGVIEYNPEEDELTSADKVFKDPHRLYASFFALKTMNATFSPLEGGKTLLLREKIEEPLIHYHKGEHVSDLISIAADLEHIVLVVEKENTALYMCGFPSPLFPSQSGRHSKISMLYAEGTLPGENGKKPPFAEVTSNGKAKFLLGKRKIKKSVPLVFLEEFPFKLPP